MTDLLEDLQDNPFVIKSVVAEVLQEMAKRILQIEAEIAQPKPVSGSHFRYRDEELAYQDGYEYGCKDADAGFEYAKPVKGYQPEFEHAFCEGYLNGFMSKRSRSQDRMPIRSTIRGIDVTPAWGGDKIWVEIKTPASDQSSLIAAETKLEPEEAKELASQLIAAANKAIQWREDS